MTSAFTWTDTALLEMLDTQAVDLSVYEVHPTCAHALSLCRTQYIEPFSPEYHHDARSAL